MPLLPRLRLLAVAVLLTVPGWASAGEASDSVLRLIPPESTLCLLVQNAREHGRAIESSPFAAWFPTSALGKKLIDQKEFEKLRGVEQFLSGLLGVKLDEIRDDIFGDAFAFVYLGGPPGKPDEEAGLILVRPRKPEVLAKLIGKLNELQTQSGELKGLKRRTHRDREYTVREKAGEGTEFYVVLGEVVVYSAQEKAIHAVIERDLSAPPVEKEAPPIAAGLKRLGVRDKMAVAWLNPRWYDAGFAAQYDATPNLLEKAFLTQFRKFWSATDGVAMFLHPAKNLELGVVLGFRNGELPPVLRTFEGKSELADAIPPDAMVAVTGRATVPKLLETIGSFLPEDARREMTDRLAKSLGPVFGKDKLPAVIRNIGPDFAVWATPPDNSDKAKPWVPGVTAIVKIRKDAETGTDVPRVVAQSLELGAQLLRVHYNQSHDDQIDFSEETRDGVTVKFLTNAKAFPPGFRPAFAVRGEYLVVATSPELVFRFAPPTSGKPPAEAPLFRVSATHLRVYLLTHTEKALDFLGNDNGKPARDLAQLAEFLEVFDKLELRSATTAGTWRLSIAIDFAKPLAK